MKEDPDPLPIPQVTQDTHLRTYVEEHKLPQKTYRPPSGYYAASKLSDCIRANYFRYVEHLPEPRDKRFETERAPMGKNHEAIVVQWFETAGLLTYKQKEVYDNELKIKGFVDMGIMDDGVEVPVEIKSIDNAERNRDVPKSDAYLQLQAYLMMLQKAHGFILYTTVANVGDWWLFRTDADPAAHRWIHNRIAELELARAMNDPPPRPVESPNNWWRCKNRVSQCPFFSTCWKGTPWQQ